MASWGPERKRTRVRLRQRRLTKIVYLVLTVYFVGLLGYSELKIWGLHRDQVRLTVELHRYQSQGQAAQEEIRHLHDPKYLSRLAEERFGLVDGSQIAYEQR